MGKQIIVGDSLDELAELKTNSVDALVTDPPAGISFMGKDWDSDKGGRTEWIAWMRSVMQECLRVLKPGAHGLVWAIPRTSHWTATALEEAGFEIRDVVAHLFGSGFPKSLNVEKAGGGQAWHGWGTALKPAAEFWILVRKPLSEKTVAKNVLKWGCGGLNIDGCRIGSIASTQGRFPANLVLDEEAAAMLDAQSGVSKSTGGQAVRRSGNWGEDNMTTVLVEKRDPGFGDIGGASRFFYCAKVSASERNAGLGDIKLEKRMSDARPKSGDMSGKFPDHDHRVKTGNHHPTVKPLKLMRYLCRLVTPPKGLILDPFTGSGSTGVAAIQEGFRFIGIEREQEYVEIAEKRISEVLI